VRARPLAVFRERLALEGAVEGVVEVAQDDPRHRPVAERKVGGLTGAPELRHDTEVDRLTFEAVVQPARLLLSLLGQPDDDGRVAVDERTGRVLALAVPDEDRAFH
jgi:hypothetical protein